MLILPIAGSYRTASCIPRKPTKPSIQQHSDPNILAHNRYDINAPIHVPLQIQLRHIRHIRPIRSIRIIRGQRGDISVDSRERL